MQREKSALRELRTVDNHQCHVCVQASHRSPNVCFKPLEMENDNNLYQKEGICWSFKSWPSRTLNRDTCWMPLGHWPDGSGIAGWWAGSRHTSWHSSCRGCCYKLCHVFMKPTDHEDKGSIFSPEPGVERALSRWQECKDYVCRPALRILMEEAAKNFQSFRPHELSKLIWAVSSQSCPGPKDGSLSYRLPIISMRPEAPHGGSTPAGLCEAGAIGRFLWIAM